jgi:hypothetical protein
MRQNGSIIFARAPETGNLIQFKQASILVSDYKLFTHTKQYKPRKVPLPECWFLAHQCDQQHERQLLSTNTINSLSAPIVLTSDQRLSTIASSRLPLRLIHELPVNISRQHAATTRSGWSWPP